MTGDYYDVVPINLTAKRQKSIAYFSCISIKEYEIVFQNLHRILHPNEMMYFSNLEYLKRQKSYLLGRYISKKVLSLYLKERDLTQIEIISGMLGQPIVRYLSKEIPGISLSHNDEFAVAIAFSEIFPIAIDIEIVNQSKIDVIQSILTNREIEFTKTAILPEETLSTLLWTSKEALSKVIRSGLMIPIKVLEVEIDDLEVDDSQKITFSLTFKNFSFLKACSWIFDNQILSIVLPKSLEMDMNVKNIESLFYNRQQVM